MVLKRQMLIILMLFFAFTGSSSQNKPSDNKYLNVFIVRAVKAFGNKDMREISGLVHKNKGLIVLYRQGSFDTFRITGKKDLTDSLVGILPLTEFSPDTIVLNLPLPEYDDDAGWNKKGLYCDLLHKDCLLSETAVKMNKSQLFTIPDEIIDDFKKLESKSYKVMLVDSKGRAFIFYITMINRKWYVTAIDRLTGDNSA